MNSSRWTATVNKTMARKRIDDSAEEVKVALVWQGWTDNSLWQRSFTQFNNKWLAKKMLVS